MTLPPSELNVRDARERCRRYRLRILDISQQVSALHIAPAYSCMEIVDVIYHSLMRHDERHQWRDTFLMSKGHGCLAQYVVLHDLGYLTDVDLVQYCQPQGRLGAHPDYGIPGIAASTGSLGHGLGMAVGMALANRLQRDLSHTYVLLSDGELQEGSTWEALMMAANLALDQLTLFLDLNDFSGLARMSTDHPAFYPVVEKLMAFGWHVHAVDGHDAQAIAMAARQRISQRPTAIVCQTIKGKGVTYMENVPIWHYRSPNAEEYQQARQELEKVHERAIC
ncbi:MAG: transketolase [Coxiella sp. RIFCSPHIGHO2_12_FULL_44_14]|nr:MAG: transketolase [Coxiella sp. RIFCSPHIGHO2_12_FULL_44_14]